MPAWAILAVSSGLGLWGAKKQSDASKKAADQQVQATDKGLALQEQIYERQVAGMQPYAHVGQQALGSLGSLMGFPAMPASVVAGPRPPGQAGNVAVPLNPNDPKNWGTTNTPLNMSDPRIQHLAKGGSMVDPEVSGQGTIGAATRSSYQGPSTGTAVPRGGGFGGPQMVRVQAPDGEVREFPEDQAGVFIARGAKRIG